MTLELVQGSGWILTIPLKIEKCSSCRENITLPFFWCKKSGRSFCSKCELDKSKILCGRIEQHEHLKIIEVKKPLEETKDERNFE